MSPRPTCEDEYRELLLAHGLPFELPSEPTATHLVDALRAAARTASDRRMLDGGRFSDGRDRAVLILPPDPPALRERVLVTLIRVVRERPTLAKAAARLHAAISRSLYAGRLRCDVCDGLAAEAHLFSLALDGTSRSAPPGWDLPWRRPLVRVCEPCRETFTPSPAAARRLRHTRFTPDRSWLSREDLEDEKRFHEAATAAITPLVRRATKDGHSAGRFVRALKRVRLAVHEASRFAVYVGRTGATPAQLRKTFLRHRPKGIVYIRPVVAIETGIAAMERWERRMIAWAVALSRTANVCVKNLTSNDRGPWPDAEFTLIYVAVCGGRELDPAANYRRSQRETALEIALENGDRLVGEVELRRRCRRRHCYDAANFVANMGRGLDPWFTERSDGKRIGWSLTDEGVAVAEGMKASRHRRT